MIVEEKKAADNLCVRGGSTFPAGCQGSRCMAWRWAEERNPDYKQPHSMQYPPLMPWDNPMTIKSSAHGYCGLAGGP